MPPKDNKGGRRSRKKLSGQPLIDSLGKEIKALDKKIDELAHENEAIYARYEDANRELRDKERRHLAFPDYKESQKWYANSREIDNIKKKQTELWDKKNKEEKKIAPPKPSKTLVEAPKREITTLTYKRWDARTNKEIERRLTPWALRH